MIENCNWCEKSYENTIEVSLPAGYCSTKCFYLSKDAEGLDLDELHRTVRHEKKTNVALIAILAVGFISVVLFIVFLFE